MTSAAAQNLKIGAHVKRLPNINDPGTFDRGEVIDRTTRSITVRWTDPDVPWTVLYFDAPSQMERLHLDPLPRS